MDITALRSWCTNNQTMLGRMGPADIILAWDNHCSMLAQPGISQRQPVYIDRGAIPANHIMRITLPGTSEVELTWTRFEELANIVEQRHPVWPGDTVAHDSSEWLRLQRWIARAPSGDWLPTPEGVQAFQLACTGFTFLRDQLEKRAVTA